jgi:hypothetical protein
MGSFVPRLLVLTLVWLLATAALTFAAAQRIGKVPVPPATTTTTDSTRSAVLVVPDVRNQAFVFAKGTLGDAGFAWIVSGAVKGYSSNLVATQKPDPGTRVLDTGAPLVTLTLTKSGQQIGLPEQVSPVPATALRPIGANGLATATASRSALSVPSTVTPAAKAAKPATTTKPKVAVKKDAKPAQKLPTNRPPAFVVAGARREPLDEIPLTSRADLLLRWVDTNPKPTDANVQRWLYQHAWIVTGARMGWWHGADALQTLLTVDGKVFDEWGIGDKSAAVARNALAFTKAQSK